MSLGRGEECDVLSLQPCECQLMSFSHGSISLVAFRTVIRLRFGGSDTKARGIGGLDDQQSVSASLSGPHALPSRSGSAVPPLLTLWTAPGPGL